MAGRATLLRSSGFARFDASSRPAIEYPNYVMTNQTSEAFAYIELEYKDAKDRVEYQRRVVEQLHWLKRTQARLKRLSLDDEASKLSHLGLLATVARRRVPVNRI